MSADATTPGEPYARRLARARAATAAAGLDALLIGAGADLRYLTGYEALALERLTLLVLPAAGGSTGAPGNTTRAGTEAAGRAAPTLIVPRLEAAPAAASAAASSGDVLVESWEETQDPMRLVADRVAGARGIDPGSFGAVAVSDNLRAAFVLGLQRVLPGARFAVASSVLGELRMHKDAAEIELLHAAAAAADRVVAAIAAGRLIGRSEIDVSREVRDRLVAEGHEQAEFAIVASGPNSASPHHHPGDRVIQAGDAIVLDIGGSWSGYGSDTTRTLWVTGGDPALGPDAEFERLYAVLQAAQAQATAAVRPGVPCEAIDATARGHITEAGYGAAFVHRTGHGIGLEGHEDPYIVNGNARPLEPGMAFSIEPGIYLEGRYGARIEDIVVCGDEGAIVLNEQPRGLMVVTG